MPWVTLNARYDVRHTKMQFISEGSVSKDDSTVPGFNIIEFHALPLE